MLRTLFALLSGLFAMMIVTTGVAIASARLLYAPPPGFDAAVPMQLRAFVEAMPAPVLALLLASWCVAAFIGGGVAARLAGPRPALCAMAIGAVVTAAQAPNALAIGYPAWVTAIAVLFPIPLAWLAARLVQKGLASTR
jgi:hypothetical protein